MTPRPLAAVQNTVKYKYRKHGICATAVMSRCLALGSGSLARGSMRRPPTPLAAMQVFAQIGNGQGTTDQAVWHAQLYGLGHATPGSKHTLARIKLLLKLSGDDAEPLT